MEQDLLTSKKLSLALDVHLLYLIQILCCVSEPYYDLYLYLRDFWIKTYKKQALDKYTCNYITYHAFFPMIEEKELFAHDQITFPEVSFTPDFAFAFKISRSKFDRADCLVFKVALDLKRHSTNEAITSFSPPVLRFVLKLKAKIKNRKNKS